MKTCHICGKQYQDYDLDACKCEEEFDTAIEFIEDIMNGKFDNFPMESIKAAAMEVFDKIFDGSYGMKADDDDNP